MPTEIFARQHMVFKDKATSEYKLLLDHDVSHSGALRDGNPTINPGGSGVDFIVTCRITEDPAGTQGDMTSVLHDMVLEGFNPDQDPEDKIYVFDILVKNGGVQLNWNQDAGTPPKQRAVVRKKSIRILEIKDLGRE